MFDVSAQHVVTEQADSHAYHSSAGGGHNIGKEPPDLSPEDQLPIKAQEVIKGNILGGHREEIHQGIADGNIEHQIGNAFVAVSIAKPFKPAA